MQSPKSKIFGNSKKSSTFSSKRGKPFTVKRVFNILLIIIMIVIFLNILFSIVNINITMPNSVAVIPIKGIIVSEGESGFFEQITSADSVIEQIGKAEENPNIKAILFEINSGGGSPVASDEIAKKIKSADKTTLALIREIGTSGAYWVASACDIIMANKMSITGSIGVISSYLEFSGALKDYNITYQRLVSGKYKDIGSPYKNLTQEEEILFQAQLDKIHEYFIAEIALNRNLSINKVRALSTGMFYLGEEALNLGLIDRIGSEEDALELLKQELDISYIHKVEYKEKKRLWDVFTASFSQQAYAIGKGIGSALSSDKKYSIRISWD